MKSSSSSSRRRATSTSPVTRSAMMQSIVEAHDTYGRNRRRCRSSACMESMHIKYHTTAPAEKDVHSIQVQ